MRHPFMESIRANPSDDLPRLVFADKLEETGQADEANFIRHNVYKPGESLILGFAPYRRELYRRGVSVIGYSRGFADEVIMNANAKREDMLLAYGFSTLMKVSGGAFKDGMQLIQGVYGIERRPGWTLIMPSNRLVKLMYKEIDKYKGIVECMDLSMAVDRLTYYEIFCINGLNLHKQRETLSKIRSDIRLAYLKQEYLRYVKSKGICDE